MPRKKAEPENVNISEEQVESQVNDTEHPDAETVEPDTDIVSEAAIDSDDIPMRLCYNRTRNRETQ